MPKHITEKVSPSIDTYTSYKLAWRDRPEVLKQAIVNAFEAVKDRKSGWMYDGKQAQYDLLFVDQYKLLKAIILENYPNQKHFRLLDIGAGEFAVIKHIAKRLNADEAIPKDIKIQLIGIRGERLIKSQMPYKPLTGDKSKTLKRIVSFARALLNVFVKSEEVEKAPAAARSSETENILIEENGICITYQIGAFQIENMIDEFQRLSEVGLPFAEVDKGVDLIISSFTFIHLVDALGTFLQACSLLRPGTGMILSDGFQYGVPEEDDHKYPGSVLNEKLVDGHFGFDVWSHIHLYWTLFSLKLPFLLNGESHVGSLNEFLIRRPDDRELSLPFQYLGVTSHPSYTSRLPRVMSIFKKTDKSLKVDNVYKRIFTDVTGDKALFDWLKAQAVFKDDRFMPKPSYISPGFVMSLKESTNSIKPFKDLTVKELTVQTQFFSDAERNTFFCQHRHESAFIQHEYDKRYGLVPR